MGEVINGYELIEPLQNRDAGFSRWTFATRGGKTYFIKEIQNPVYPDNHTLSQSLRDVRIAECTAFENSSKKLYEAINHASDGNAIRIYDFFRCNSRYYIVTEKVDCVNLSCEEVSCLPLSSRILLCATIAHSIMQLHKAKIIHADIKNSNILLQMTPTGMLAGKLIDFGSSFFEYEPPEDGESMGADQVYLAPETCRFICDEPVKLTCNLDVFSLGVLFHEYLTGALPEFDHSKYDFIHEALLDGAKIHVSNKLPPDLRNLLESMLDCNPDKRPDSSTVFLLLQTSYLAKGAAPRAPGTSTTGKRKGFYEPVSL